jgi:hypothetical protein
MQRIIRYFLVAVFIGFSVSANAGFLDKLQLSGMYVQWGYNRDCYSKSTIHFRNGNKYDFKLVNAVAHDKPDFRSIITDPLQVSIPQYNYRLGFYLNPKHTHAIELNFDHTKYVVTDYQNVRITGTLAGRTLDKDTILDPKFLHFEHTDGANFLHINYVGQYFLFHTRKTKRPLLSAVTKLGAGIVIPRTDFTFEGKRLNNKFHVAGYVISAEAGFRFYPLKNLFLEATLKGGFANYLNALTIEGGTARHHFFYGEAIALIGYNIRFK